MQLSDSVRPTRHHRMAESDLLVPQRPTRLERAQDHILWAVGGAAAALGLGAAGIALGLLPLSWRVAAVPLAWTCIGGAAIGEAVRYATAARRPGHLPWFRAAGATIAAAFVLLRAASHIWPETIDLTAAITQFVGASAVTCAAATFLDARRSRARGELPPLGIAATIAGAIGFALVGGLLLGEDHIGVTAWRVVFGIAVGFLGSAGAIYLRLRGRLADARPNGR